MSRRFGHSASLFAIALLCSFSLPAIAQEDGRLRARVDAGAKLGTERSLGSVEAWVPLDQGNDRVLYGDIRFMMDDADNAEGNLGVGYRQIVTDMPFAGRVIAGGHAWLDGRRTDLGSNFKQVTLGGELLGEDWDVRANAYVPLSNEKTHLTANTGSATPYLAGGGIFYDTQGRLLEEPQPGLDLELGYRLPVLEDHVESVRVYGGLYHFEGDRTEDVSGWRTRLVAEISPAISVGARFQKDDERGSQGFLEATVRFPFDAKKSFRKEGLRARLDESPERDVDIVSGSKVTDTGAAKPVLNANSGEVQRVLHVDNTAAPGGDGTKDRPFHQLKLAEAALLANDVIYLHAGNGTTSGQNLGIVIDKPNVSLIGSGTDFIFDNGKFIAGRNLTGTIIAPKTTAPVITNTVDTGIIVDNDNAVIAGLTVSGTARNGISLGLGATDFYESFKVYDVTVRNNNTNGISLIADQATGSLKLVDIRGITAQNNGTSGVSVRAWNGAGLGDVKITDVQSSGNTARGVHVSTAYTSQVNNIVLDGIKTNSNTVQGVWIENAVNSHINNVSLSNIISNQNNNAGISVSASSAALTDNLTLRNVAAASNSQNGIYIASSTGGIFENAYLENIETRQNGGDGLNLFATNGRIENIDVRGVVSRNNVVSGIIAQATSSGVIDSFKLEGADSGGNQVNGVFVHSFTNGTINVVNLANITTNNNTGIGTRLLANTNSVIDSATLNNITANNNSSYGAQVYSSTGSTLNHALLNNITANSNTGYGVIVYSRNGALLDTASLSNISTSNNVGQGVYVLAELNSVLNTATLNNIVTSNNTVYGVIIESTGSSFGLADLNNVTARNHASSPGIYVTAHTNGNLGMFSLKNAASTGNNYGVYLNDDTAGAFNANLSGANSLHGNTTADLRLDLDGGVVNAQGNWWGQAGGPLAGRVVSENNAACPGSCGTANTSGALTAAP